MHQLMQTYLGHKAGQYAALLTAQMSKADGPEDEQKTRVFDLYLTALMDGTITWDDLPPQIVPIIESMAKSGASDGLAQVADLGQMRNAIAMDVVNTDAVAWSRERGAELVGMKYVDGELVPNPNAKWSIEETTRDAIRDLVEQATEEGWSMDRLAGEIASDAAFSDERAMMIARTESATADVQGNLIGYRAAEQVGVTLLKQWITAEDDLVSEDCQANAEQGPIGLDEDFASGVSAPPEHPNCRCDVLPVQFPTEGE